LSKKQEKASLFVKVLNFFCKHKSNLKSKIIQITLIKPQEVVKENKKFNLFQQQKSNYIIRIITIPYLDNFKSFKVKVKLVKLMLLGRQPLKN
jgi:hypothetical protein